MRKQRVAQRGGVAHRRLGREILRRQAAGKADDGQQQQNAAPHKDIVEVVGCNAHVDDVCHHQRHEQVERGFQHLEKRCKHALALVAVQVAKHFIQGSILPFFDVFSQNSFYYSAFQTGMPCFRLRKTENPAILERNLKRKEWWMLWQKMVRHGCGCARWARQTAKSCRNTGRWVQAAPAIERAVAALYKGQNEESFWALMNAINYALELDTRVLVPLEAASDQPDGAAPWAEHPVPAEKAKDLPPWTLHTQKGR